MTTEKQIEAMGWTLEYHQASPWIRAAQGNFNTNWRSSPEAVLADLRAMHEARKEADRTGKPF